MGAGIKYKDEIENAKIDAITYGTSIIELNEDGSVKHIPLQDFYIEAKE